MVRRGARVEANFITDDSKTLMKIGLMILLCATSMITDCSLLKAQDAAVQDKATPVLYFEITGNGGSLLSVNYEVLLLEPQLRASIGISTVDIAPGTIPMMLRYLFFGETSWLEVGAGVSLVYRYAANDAFYEYSQSKVNPTAFIGYRYQPIDSGFVFHFGYAPTYDVGHSYLFSKMSLIVGWAF